MRTIRNIALFILRAIVLLLFVWLSFFWMIVLVYSVENYMRGGGRAVMGWLFHISHQPNPDGFGFRPLTIQIVLLRLLGMLVITILLWLANRRLSE
jgi:hypothetical protein